MPCDRIDQIVAAKTTMLVTEETTWGQFDEAQTPLGVEFTGETLKEEIRRRDERYAMFAGGRAPRPGLSGRRNAGGSVDGEFQPHGFWPLILRHALGTLVSTSALGGGLYQHELVAGDDLPVGLTLEKVFRSRAGTVRRFRYPGCKVGSFYVRVAVGSVAQCRASFVAHSEATPFGEPPDAQYATNNLPFTFIGGQILLDQGSGLFSTGFIQNLEMTISNGLADEKYSANAGAYRYGIIPGSRIASGGMRAMFTDEAYQAYLMSGENTTGSVRLVLSRFDADTGQTYSATITLPSVKFRVDSPQNTGRGPVSADLKYTAFYDDAAETDVQVTLVNRDPTLTT